LRIFTRPTGSNDPHELEADRPPTSFITLSDGRRLAFVERGDPHGLPILHHHGMPGSRLQHGAEPELYARLGLRVITPDRPGYGLSDPHRRGALAGWARDVEELMDALHVGRFGVTALSGGGIYALAVAWAMPDRLTGVSVTGCPAPMQIAHASRGMRFMTSGGIAIARHTPWLLEGGGWLVGGFVRTHTKFIYDQSNRHKPKTDLMWLSSPSVASGALDDLREGLRNGAGGYVDDVETLARPWDFDPSRVEAHVDLWHGDADTVIPVAHSRYLARVMPHATLHVCPGEGHMLLWSHAADVLLDAAGREPAAEAV
jgi:pimeloyl-ACP methyl ester carboxylesterase